MAQTNYAYEMGSGKVGMLADLGNKDVITRTPSADVKVGLFVSLGASDTDCESPDATGDVTGKGLGVVLAEQSVESSSAGTAPTVKAKKPASILKKGRVWVYTEQAVTPSDTVFVRFAGTGDLGAFRKDADTANAVALPGAKFLTTASAAALVQLELNLP